VDHQLLDKVAVEPVNKLDSEAAIKVFDDSTNGRAMA
jgi:hypothetical protein